MRVCFQPVICWRNPQPIYAKGSLQSQGQHSYIGCGLQFWDISPLFCFEDSTFCSRGSLSLSLSLSLLQSILCIALPLSLPNALLQSILCIALLCSQFTVFTYQQCSKTWLLLTVMIPGWVFVLQLSGCIVLVHVESTLSCWPTCRVYRRLTPRWCWHWRRRSRHALAVTTSGALARW